MLNTGMTSIAKNVARLVSGFIVVFGVYVALTGHLSPGGGFAGGVVLASAAVLLVVAFGRAGLPRWLRQATCRTCGATGALMFLVIAVLGYSAGAFFVNFLYDPDAAPALASGGTIPLCDLAVLLNVGGGLAGAFMALSAYRLMGESEPATEKDI